MSEELKIANPAPLGLAGFGVTTVVLSCVNAGLLPAEALPVVVPLAFAFGGVAQMIAGVMEFKNGNTFGTVAFMSYGAFWWWYAFLNWTVGAGWIKSPDPRGVGVAASNLGRIYPLYVDRDLSYQFHSLVNFSASIDHILPPCGRRSRHGCGLAQTRRLARSPHWAGRAVSFFCRGYQRYV